jgi:hypothetical protein
MNRHPSKYGVERADYPDEKSYLAAHQRARRKTPEGKADVRRMNLHYRGITPEFYDALLLAQDGKCAVCGTTDPGQNSYGPQSFCVDHDWSCCPPGRNCGNCVRGLLCSNCNRAEGLLGCHAQELADYLKRYEERKQQCVAI